MKTQSSSLFNTPFCSPPGAGDLRLTGLTSESRPPVSILVEGVLTGLWKPLEYGRGQHLTSRPCKSCGVLFKGDYNPSPWLGVGNPRAHSQGLHQTMQSVLLAPVTAALGNAQARILVAKGLGTHTGVPRI